MRFRVIATVLMLATRPAAPQDAARFVGTWQADTGSATGPRTVGTWFVGFQNFC